MLYPQSLEEKIGMNRLRERLRKHCSGSLGREYVDQMAFSAQEKDVARRLDQSLEFCQILQEGGGFPQSNFLDLRSALKKASIEGSYLDLEEFHDLRSALRTLYACTRFFYERREDFPELWKLAEHVAIPLDVLQALDRVLDDEGRLRNNASPELNRLRSQIAQTQHRLRRRIETLLRQFKNQSFTKDDAELTVRDGRMVIPVKAEYKRQVKGFVHDSSASGQTVYMEPEEILEINNEVRELIYAERREILRILKELTQKIRPHLPALRAAFVLLGQVDFVRAKARLAMELKAVRPKLSKKPALHWQQARHPLLYLTYTAEGREVVPYDIRLSFKERILLISGPNAGGKSVCLKTVGLVQYMLQCGMLVPVEEGSEFGLFKEVFIDIGDEQSIENDLSTYSSHLANMRKFIEHATRDSLCLIDEFGTGTEPQYGGAIAEAILVELNRRKSWGVITTHYDNLKYMAEKTPGIVNGAMRFDTEKLAPLFLLEIGQPGSSFAFEIAQKMGLPRPVLDRARSKVGKTKMDVEKVIQELEKEKKELRERNARMAQKESKLQKQLGEYREKREAFDSKRQEILEKARLEASGLLKNANQRIEKTIREIKENKADKQKTKQAREKLEEYQQNIAPKLSSKAKLSNPKLETEEGEIREGDKVAIQGQNTHGEVLELKGKEALVRMGDLRSWVKVRRLARLSRKSLRELEHKVRTGTGGAAHLYSTQMRFKPELDLRGKRAEEAVSAVRSFMDDAVMTGQLTLRILHGKGTGALRQITREILKEYPEVKRIADEHADFGGDGITVIGLEYGEE